MKQKETTWKEDEEEDEDDDKTQTGLRLHAPARIEDS